MALVACKECKESVSEKAKVCPKCGIKNPAGMFPKPLGGIKRRKKSSDTLDAFKGLVFFLVIGFIGFQIFGGDSSDDAAVDAKSDKKPQAWYMGGTLHEGNVGDWKAASAVNKIATTSTWTLSALGDEYLKNNGEDATRTKSVELAACIEVAIESRDLPDNYKIFGLGVACGLDLRRNN